MANLPSEIWNNIQNFLSAPKDQSQFRRSNSETNSTDFNAYKLCCSEPSKFEIADWLLEKRSKIAPNYRLEQNPQTQYMRLDSNDFEELSFFFEDITDLIDVLKIDVTRSGKILYPGSSIRYDETGRIRNKSFWVLATSRDDLIALLENRRLRFIHTGPYSHEWEMLRGILQRRKSCVTANVNTRVCLLELFEKYKDQFYVEPNNYNYMQDNWHDILLALNSILNINGKRKFINIINKEDINLPPYNGEELIDFLGMVPDLPVLTMPDYGYDNQVYQTDPDNYHKYLNDKLNLLYSQLEPTDLVS